MKDKLGIPIVLGSKVCYSSKTGNLLISEVYGITNHHGYYTCQVSQITDNPFSTNTWKREEDVICLDLYEKSYPQYFI